MQVWDHRIAAEGGRRIDLEHPARFRMQLAHGQFRRLDFFQDGHRAFIIGAAFLGQADRPRGAVEKPCPEPVFEPSDQFADRRRRDAQVAGRSGKSPTVYRADKHRHFTVPVHIASQTAHLVK